MKQQPSQPTLLRKVLPVVHFKTLDAAQGIAEMIVSVFNNVDAAGERVLLGAFTKSLARKFPKGVWMHDWTSPVAKTLEAVELAPGDDRLPEAIRDLGGLYVKGQFNLKTQRGAEAFADLDFGTVDEFSIGYLVTQDNLDHKSGVRDLIELRLYEWSPVLVGCNDSTALLGTKETPALPASSTTTDPKGNDMAETKQAQAAALAAKESTLAAKEATVKTISLHGQNVEVKGQYLGDYIESQMTYSALDTLVDALFYDVFWDVVRGSWDWDEDGEEYIRTFLPVDEGAAVLFGACDEFRDLVVATYRALMAGAGADAMDAAKALRATSINPKTKDFAAAPRAGVKLAQHSEQVLANVQEFIGRVRSIQDLRVKEGRALSQANRDRLQAHYETLTSACQDVKSLLDETAPATADQGAETENASAAAQKADPAQGKSGASGASQAATAKSQPAQDDLKSDDLKSQDGRTKVDRAVAAEGAADALADPSVAEDAYARFLEMSADLIGLDA